MTNLKMLEKLHAIAGNPTAEPIGALIAEIEKDAKKEEARKTGRAPALKAAARIIKSAKAHSHESLRGAWIAGDGLQYVRDGFRVIRFRDPLPLDQIPQNVTPCNMATLFDRTKRDRGEALTLPSASALRAFIKSEKARLKAVKDKSTPLWDFGDGLPSVDAGYLLDMIDAIPGATAKASKKRPALGSILFESEDGSAEGLLCPVRKGATK